MSKKILIATAILIILIPTIAYAVSTTSRIKVTETLGIFTKYDIYSPNVTISVNGTGWKPLESVTITFNSTNSTYTTTIIADEYGRFYLNLTANDVGNYTIYANQSNLNSSKNIKVERPYSFYGIIFNTDNNPVPSDLELYEETNHTLVAVDDEVYNISLNYGVEYQLIVYPKVFPIVKEVRINIIANNGYLENVLGLDNLFAYLGYDEIFVFYPTLSNYEYATIVLNDTKDYEKIYKCAEWDFYARKCNTTFLLIGNLNQTTYIFKKGDPAIAFLREKATTQEKPKGSWPKWWMKKEVAQSNETKEEEQGFNSSIFMKLSWLGLSQPTIIIKTTKLDFSLLIIFLISAALIYYLYERRVILISQGITIKIRNISYILRREAQAVYVIIESRDIKNIKISSKRVVKELREKENIKKILSHLVKKDNYVIYVKDKCLVVINEKLKPNELIEINYEGSIKSCQAFALMNHSTIQGEREAIKCIGDNNGSLTQQAEKAIIDLQILDTEASKLLQDKARILKMCFYDKKDSFFNEIIIKSFKKLRDKISKNNGR